jgi:hypothetical protein
MTDFSNPNINLKFVGGKFIDADHELVSVPKIVVDIADYLTQLVPFISPNGRVESESDWLVVEKLFEAFIRCYPYDYDAHLKNINRQRNAHSPTRGYVKGTDLKAQTIIPERFDQLLKLFYPLQTYDTKFARRLAKELPVLKVA